MGDRVSKNALFDGLASLAKAMGNGRRAEIVDVLSQGERAVDELSREIGQSVANTSHHLQILARSGVVASRREGTHVHYRLASDRVGDLWAALRDVAAEQVAGFDKLAEAYLGERDDLPTMTREELASRLGDPGLVVIDVRPATEYAAGHIPSARSVLPGQAVARASELPADAQIVAYCRGPWCSYAVDAVRDLRASGRNAYKLEEGFPEWRRAGLPVDSPSD